MLTRGKKKATLSDPSELVFEDGAPCFRSSGVINLQSIYRFFKRAHSSFCLRSQDTIICRVEPRVKLKIRIKDNSSALCAYVQDLVE